uniref:Reverse transcriptase Ty1/copia-type domain-containing protein n=1 Tax=Solanum lycopersicum TaxID=4081 RepID=A0A3Q7GPN1_SOLLC
MTRTNISYAVQTLSQFMHDPKQSHLEGELHVVRYLKENPGLGILLSSDKDDSLNAFCDFDWASCAVTRKSITGYCVKLGKSLVSWKSKKQETMSMSTTEAEYRSMASAVAEIILLVGLLKEMNMEVKIP